MHRISDNYILLAPPKKNKTRCITVCFYFFYILILFVTILCVITHCHALSLFKSDDLKQNSSRESRNRYEDIFEKYNDVEYWSAHGEDSKDRLLQNDSSTGHTQLTTDNVRIVCYYIIPGNNSWINQLLPHSVDPYFCTHIIVGFTQVSEGLIAPTAFDIDAFKTVIYFKKINRNLKILLSVEEISSFGEFSKMIACDSKRTMFINSTVKFLEELGFDGIDVDWEFPSWPNADLNQVKNFTLFLKELRQHIDISSKNLQISVAVAAPELIMQQSYEIGEMSKYVDFINIMSYDYHMYSKYLPLTGPNAPLYARPSDTGYLQTLNTNWSAYHWAEWGMPKSKINVGIPTYGHSFRLINENNNGWNAPSNGFGDLGGNGFISYNLACQFVSNISTSHFFDDGYQVPYAYNGKTWISYENTISVNLKAQYILDNGFGGAMIYSLNNDDFSGGCGQHAFPLLGEINNVLNRNN